MSRKYRIRNPMSRLTQRGSPMTRREAITGGGRGRSDVSKTRASWNHRNDHSREGGRNRSFALCSRALDDLINGPKYSDILLLGNCHPTTCPNPVWGEVKKMSRHVSSF